MHFTSNANELLRTEKAKTKTSMRSNQSIWVVVMKMTKFEEKYFDVASRKMNKRSVKDSNGMSWNPYPH